MGKKNIHIVPSSGQLAVKKEGSERDSYGNDPCPPKR